MIQDNRSISTERYQVKVGHTDLVVEGVSHKDAIQQARKRLCLDMPRMWDVIQALEDTRFKVSRMN